MDTTNTIRSIIESEWEDECMIIDNVTLENIITSVQSNNKFEETFSTTEGGASMELIEIIKLIFEAAALIKICLEVWKLLDQNLHHKPTKDELIKAIKEKTNHTINITSDKLEAIVYYITNHDKSRI